MIEYQMQALDVLSGETCGVKKGTKNDLPTVTEFVDHLRSEGWTVLWGGPKCGRPPKCWKEMT